MASTVQSAVKSPEPIVTERPDLLARLEKHRKPISYAAGAVVLLGLAGWLFTETGRRKEIAGADALDGARSAFESGNLPGASAAFQRVIQSYRGTDAAYQAELGLNAVRLASGQAQLAVDELKKFTDANPPAYYASGAMLMMGGALENLSKFDQAAAAYSSAAERAQEPYRKVEALLGTARSYRLAGKEKEALDVLRGIVSKFPAETPGVPEAKVRLAELTRGAM
jgi:TolA-binding protein